MSRDELLHYALLTDQDKLKKLVKRTDNLSVDERWELLDNRHEIHKQCVALYKTSSGWLTGISAWQGRIFDKISSDVNDRHAVQKTAANDSAGIFRIYLFPTDPMMPDLESATDTATYFDSSIWQKSGKLLHSDKIGRLSGSDTEIQIIPLRYRPCMCCTLKVVFNNREGERNFISKVYTRKKTLLRTYEVMRRLYFEQRKIGATYFARPIGQIPDKQILVQDFMPGVDLDAFLRDVPEEETAVPGKVFEFLIECGSAIRFVHTTECCIKKRRPLLSELSVLCKKADDINDINPNIGAILLTLSGLLKDTYRHDRSEPQYCLTHGDFKPGQVLVDDCGIHLLDFDNAALSDPAFDIGTFIATLKQNFIKSLNTDSGMTINRRKRITERFISCFLQGYYRNAEIPDRKIGWCVSLSLLRKAIREVYKDHNSKLIKLLIDEALLSLENMESGRIHSI